MKRLIVLLPWLIGVNMNAQLGPEHRFVYPGDAWALAIADVDNDGDGDIVRSTTGPLVVHAQVAPNTYSVIYELGMAGIADRVRFADLDGDGIEDIVLSRRTASAVAWVRVLGGGNFGVLENLVAGIPQAFDVQIEDVDGDGDPDLVFAYAMLDATLAWAPNLGGGVFGATQVIVATSFSVDPQLGSFFDSGDIDQDGDIDFMTRTANALKWWENDGVGGFSLVSIPGSSGVYDVQLADIDGDLAPDILFSRSNDLWKCVNNGSGGFAPEEALMQYTTNLKNRMEALDLDGDGDEDVAYRRGGGIGISHVMGGSINDGIGNFSQVGSALPGDFPQPFAYGDLNGAPPLDLVGYANDGLYVAPFPQRLNSVTGAVHVSISDFDLDGDNDVVLSGQNWFSPLAEGLRPLQLALHSNDGAGVMLQSPEELWVSAASIARADAKDLDGDGDDDLVALWQEPQAGTMKQFMVLENQNGVFDSIGAIGPQWFPWIPEDPFQPVLRDIDGDTDIDLMRHISSGLYRSANNGSAVFGPEQEFDPGGMWILSAATLCDVDNSSLPDYVWSHGNFGGAGPDSIFWNENLGLGVPGPNQFVAISPVLTFANVPIHSQVLSGTDLNSDGLEDLLIFNGDSLGVMYNTGGVLNPAQEWACNAIAYAVGDMDGNGYVDIVTLSPNADIIAYLNNGLVFGVGQLMAAAPQSTGTSHLALADMDGDLDLDVITCAVNGSAAWLGNTGNFPLGISETRVHETVHMYPNPSSSGFTVHALWAIQSVQLLDVRGHVLWSIPGNGTNELRIERGDLSAGLYVVRAVQSTGAVATSRVVVG
ncbi:MAG: T9SS type A sorting domain-containing protein [Flavobacteriales bacterium]